MAERTDLKRYVQDLHSDNPEVGGDVLLRMAIKEWRDEGSSMDDDSLMLLRASVPQDKRADLERFLAAQKVMMEVGDSTRK